MPNSAAASPWPGRLILAGVLALLYAPIAMVCLYSFTESRLGMVWRGFTVRWYGELVRDSELAESLGISILLGSAASTGAVVLGACAAVGLPGWSLRPRRAAQAVLGLPLVVPDLILALALGIYFHALGIEKCMVTVILAHMTFGVAYAFVVVSAAVQDLDPNLYRAALDCGATPAQAFWRVLLPLFAPSLITAWLFVFALSFDDFLIAFFTKGVGADTLPIKVYGRMRLGVRPDINALFTLLFLVTLAGTLLALRVQRGGSPARGRSRLTTREAL